MANCFSYFAGAGNTGPLGGIWLKPNINQLSKFTFGWWKVFEILVNCICKLFLNVPNAICFNYQSLKLVKMNPFRFKLLAQSLTSLHLVGLLYFSDLNY